MRIMHLLESLEFGGAEKVVVHLANKFSEDNEVSICVTKRTGELASDVNNDIKIYCLNSPEGNNHHLAAEIKELLIKNNIDILHSHNWGIYVNAALAVRTLKNTKLIHTIHGPYMNYMPGMVSIVKIKLRHIIEMYLSKYACKIVVVSKSIKNYIIHDINIKENLLRIIHNGIADVGKSTSEHKNSIVKFVTVGRLAKIKNQILLLKACKKTLKLNNDFHLTFVGDGPEKNNLINFCNENNLNEYVTFLGFRDDVINILQEHDVFLLSSDYEGISIALLESMSLAMPSIATNVGGLPDTLIDNKTGYLVPPNDFHSYSDKLLEFINEPSKINTMGNKARDFFLSQFHEDVVINEYRTLYHDCLGTRV